MTRIRASLDQAKPKNGRLRVSVANDTRWEKSGNEEVHVRWMCWSLHDGNRELVEPQFEVLSPSVTRERLAVDLPPLFPGVHVVVDDDIDM